LSGIFEYAQGVVQQDVREGILARSWNCDGSVVLSINSAELGSGISGVLLMMGDLEVL